MFTYLRVRKKKQQHVIFTYVYLALLLFRIKLFANEINISGNAYEKHCRDLYSEA